MHRNRCRGNVDLLPEATQKPRLETNLTREAEYSSTGSPIGSDKDCPSELNAFDGCQIQATLEFGGGKLGCRTGQGDQILCRNIERCLNVVMTENLAIAQEGAIFARSSMFPYLPLRGLPKWNGRRRVTAETGFFVAALATARSVAAAGDLEAADHVEIHLTDANSVVGGTALLLGVDRAAVRVASDFAPVRAGVGPTAAEHR